jgi:energy-coupling factor transporter ATP-binding protein EcfA2
MVGELPPLRGHARLGSNVQINYYAQAHEGLVMSNSILDEMRRVRPLIKETEARTFLGRFLFSGDDVFKRIGTLSGGERGRVALAQLTLIGGNLLILDEPTNHLDIGAREALEDVLNEYDGTILFVSHDRYFIDAVADTLWTVDNNKITVFDGNYSEHRELMEAKEAQSKKAATTLVNPTVPKAAAAANPAPAKAAPAPALTQDQERQLTINEKLAQIQREMPELYAAQRDEIVSLVEASAGLTEAQERNKTIVTGIAESIGSAVKSSLDLVIDGTKNWADSLREIASNLLRSIADQLLQILVITPIVKAVTGAFGFAGGGIMTDDGPMPLKTYARGGIANSPQLAMFGEGSMPEAYVPLPDGRRIPVAMQGGSGGNTVVNVSVDAKGSSVQGNSGQGEQLGRVIAQAVQAELVKQRRPGGILAAA